MESQGDGYMWKPLAGVSVTSDGQVFGDQIYIECGL